MPEDTPVTIPVLPTVAIVVLLLLHTPPGVASLSVVVYPGVTDEIPVMDAGVAGKPLTVTTVVAEVLPQALVTV